MVSLHKSRERQSEEGGRVKRVTDLEVGTQTSNRPGVLSAFDGLVRVDLIELVHVVGDGLGDGLFERGVVGGGKGHILVACVNRRVPSWTTGNVGIEGRG